MSENTFFRKWLEGKANDEDIMEEGKALFSNQDDLDQYKMIIDATGDLKLPSNEAKEGAWNNLLDKIGHQEIESPVASQTKVVSMKRFSYLKVAAVAAVFVLAFTVVLILRDNPQTTFVTGNSEQKTITLPDQSTVILNAGSIISYNPSNWKENRLVSLKGEAFFNVKTGTKFEVESEIGKVGVLGTSFNVKARPNEYEVSCFTGKVEVYYKAGNSSKILTKGLATKIGESALIDPFGFIPNKVSGWQSGLFYFEEAPLSSVFEEVERQFDVELQIKSSLEDRIYSGHFKRNGLNEALELICLPMNLGFEVVDEKTIVIMDNNE